MNQCMERTSRLPDEIVLNGRKYVAEDVIPKAAAQAPVEEMFTVEEVSRMSGVSRRTIYSLLERRVLNYTVPNGCVRPRLIRRTEYERWVGLTS